MMMVDAAYDELYRAMKPWYERKPGRRTPPARCSTISAPNSRSDQRDLRRAPQPPPARLPTARPPAGRPGLPRHSPLLHAHRTCYYRCFAIGFGSRALVDALQRCRDYLDAAICPRGGARLAVTRETAEVWPKAQEFGSPNEEAAFGRNTVNKVHRLRHLGETGHQPPGSR